MKRVISLWLPKFATDRLCRLRQDWLDSPLGMIHETGGQLLLHAVNHTAEQAGIRAGMTLADACAILPDLKTSEADIPAETKSLSRLADWCGRYTPWTAPDEEGSGAAFAGGGSIWLDVTGCAHLFGGEEALMRDIIDRLDDLGFTAYAAIADTPGQPGQPPVTPAISAAVGLPFAKDRHKTFLQCFLSPDFGWSTISFPVFRLSACAGSATLCRSARCPCRSFWQRRRRSSGSGFRRSARTGISACASQPLACTHQFCGTGRKIGRHCRCGTQPCPRSCLHARKRRSRRPPAYADLLSPDGVVDRLEAGTSQSSRNADHLARLFISKLDRITAAFGIDAITLTATASEKLSAAQAALDRRDENHNTGVAELADRLSNRLGSENVVQLTLQESHIPERAISANPVTARPRPVPAAPWRSGSL